MPTNYEAWGALPQAGAQFLNAFQQAKAAKAKEALAGLEQRRTEAEIGKLEAEAGKLGGAAASKRPYGEYGIQGVPDYLKGALASPEEAFKLESDIRGEKQKAGQQGFSQGKELRQEYAKASKDFTDQTSAIGRVRASADKPSAAGDLALIFNYMKVLDPGSTVREGEFATAQNAAGVDERTKAVFNRVVNGERLSEQQRGDFLNRAEGLYGNAYNQHKQRIGQYTEIAKRAGLDPRDVIVKLEDLNKMPTNAPTKEEAQAVLADPNSDEEDKAAARKILGGG